MKREAFWALLGLAAAFWVVLGPFLRGDLSIATFQDNTYLLLPLFSFASRALESGEAPYWIDSLVAGLPLYNTPQFSWTYPLYLLGLGLYRGPVEAIWHVHAVTFLHVGLLGLNTYVALRLLATSPLGSSLGAGLVMLSANTMHYTTWINITAPYAWLPLVLAGGFLAVGGPRRAFGALTLAGALGMLIRAAPSQALIHALFCLAVIAGFGLGRLLWQASYRGALRSIGALAGGGALALAIGAPAVLPAMLATGGAIRWIGDFPPVVGWQALPFGGMLVGQLAPMQLLAAVLPFDAAVNPAIGDPYVGPAAIWLAAVALAVARQRWVVLPLMTLALYTLLSASGSHLGFAQINYYLPFVNQIREPGRHLVVFVLCCGLLAGIGFDAMRAHLAAGWRAFVRGVPLAPLAFGFLLVGVAVVTRLPVRIGGTASAAAIWFAAMLGALVLSAVVRGWLRPAALGAAALCAVASSQQFLRPVPPVSAGDYYEAPNLASHAVLQRLAAMPDAHQYRFLVEDTALNTQFWSMNATYYGLRSFQAYMNPMPFRQFTEVFHRPMPHYYPLLGTKYVICRPCTSPVLRDFRPAGTVEGYSLFVAEAPQPRYALATAIAGTYASADDFFALVSRGFDYGSTVAVHRADERAVRAWLTGAEGGAAAGSILEISSRLNRVQLRVTSPAPAMLLLNEYATPDWQAAINGRRARTLTANLNQVGLLVGPGTSEVTFEYRPTLFIWLRRLSLAAGLVLAAGAAILWRRARRTIH